MNTPTHYIVYGTDAALRGGDPAHCHECTSVTQALAVANKYHVDPAIYIRARTGSAHSIFFHNLDELCCDLLRNHGKHFSIKSDLHDGYPETIALSLTCEQVFSWVLSHADELEMLDYTLDYNTSLGKYMIGNICETYIIQELKSE